MFKVGIAAVNRCIVGSLQYSRYSTVWSTLPCALCYKRVLLVNMQYSGTMCNININIGFTSHITFYCFVNFDLYVMLIVYIRLDLVVKPFSIMKK